MEPAGELTRGRFDVTDSTLLLMGAVPTASAFTRNVFSPQCRRRRTRLYQRTQHIHTFETQVGFHNIQMDDPCTLLQASRYCTARMASLWGLSCHKDKIQIILPRLRATVQVRTLDRCMTIVALHSPVIPQIK